MLNGSIPPPRLPESVDRCWVWSFFCPQRAEVCGPPAWGAERRVLVGGQGCGVGVHFLLSSQSL